jgi:PAS domain-containing protein
MIFTFSKLLLTCWRQLLIRQKAEEALRRAHDELEIRVQERTKDLFKANSELQQEIIERKIAEEERAKLIAILEATPDFVATASIDKRTRYLNSAARKVFGFGENDDSTNFTIPDVYPAWAYEIIENEAIPVARRDGLWVGETAVLRTMDEKSRKPSDHRPQISRRKHQNALHHCSRHYTTKANRRNTARSRTTLA